MYAPGPAYGGGYPTSAPFHPNNGVVPPQAQSTHPHQQQQQQMNQQMPPSQNLQHHQQQQQAQHVMFNPQQQQQYGGVPGHPSPYNTPSPGLGGNAAGMGMMQNNGTAHMAGGHAMPTYQTPYSSSPYGGGMPTSTAASLPPNFMPPTNQQAFNMNANMNPNLQHPSQRMQPPPTSSTPSQPNQHMPPFPGQHNTPPNAGSAQSQFTTPQATNQTHLQSSNSNQQGQAQSGTIVTPQTPTFPQNAHGTNTLATPLSPGSETREKDRVTLLLEINRELLMEVMRQQKLQAENKKDESSGTSPDGADKDKSEQEKPDKTNKQGYVGCMRRLQSNLAYLAAIADRSHKPSSSIPPHPAYMSAPPLPSKSTIRSRSAKIDSPISGKTEASEDKKVSETVLADEERADLIRDQYKRLQALFPGVDPNSEPQANPAARAAASMQAQKQPAVVGGGGGNTGGVAVDVNAQQKFQNDLLRQKMMQAAQQQQHMAQGMNNPQQMR